MPRFARPLLPHSLHHLISRFVNRAYRLGGDVERGAYLARVPAVLLHTDWAPLSFALMSSHVHWAVWSGLDPSRRFIQPLHLGFAQWLNRHQGTLGPVFAGRHTSVACRSEQAAVLLAYIHNNPVRAGVVRDPAESAWTSHAAYLGLAAAPPWLHVERGLSLCGFDASPRGRWAFHDYVVGRALGGRDPLLSDEDISRCRRQARTALGAPVELGAAQPAEAGDGPVHDVLARPGGVLRPRWPGPAELVLDRVAAAQGVAVGELRSRDRRRRLAEARRLALRVWSRYLNRPQGEMGAALGLSSSAVSHLLRTAMRSDAHLASDIAQACWAAVGEQN